MSDDREFLGHAIVNGVIQFLSVSAAEKAAPFAGGCYRRWNKRYVGGDKEAENEKSRVAKQKGVDMHARIAHFLKTGENILKAPEIKGVHMLPKPGADLWVEQKFHRVTYDTTKTPTFRYDDVKQEHPRYPVLSITSSLTAARIPFIGFIDLAHGRLETWTEDEGRIIDPVGTVEVMDHKFKTNAKDRQGNSTLIHPSELVRTIQMAGYGRVVANTQKHAERVRLSHLVYPEKGDKPRKITKLHVLDDCLRTWELVEGVTRTLVDVAKETDWNRVDGNVQSCDMYGGCPFRDKCTKYQTTSIDNYFEKIAADFVNNKEPDMGLLTSNPQIMQQQQQAQAPQQPQQGYQMQPGQWQMPPGVPQPEVSYGGGGVPQQQQMPQQVDMRTQLAAEEAQMKAQQVQQQVSPPTPTFVQAWQKLLSFGRGQPALGGAAAMAYAMMRGYALNPGSGYAGTGDLGHITLQDPAHVMQLVGELEAQARQAPMQNPAPQQAPAYTLQINPANFQTQPQAGGILPPNAPESQPQLASQVAAPAAPVVPEDAAPAGRGRGRPKKNKDASGAPSEPVATVSATPIAVTPPPAQSTPAPGVTTQVAPTEAPTFDPYLQGIMQRDTTQPMILINTRALSTQSKSLAPYVDYINEKLARMYNRTKTGEQGPLDVRAPVEGSILGYGGWKGCVRECVKAEPPPPGVWHLDTYMDDLNEAVADGLRALEGKGWMYFRGVR